MGGDSSQNELALIDKLTYKQRAFVVEYLKDFNGTRAAQRAGYKGNDQTLAAVASENLRKPKVKAFLEHCLKQQAMSANEVLTRLAQQARSEATEYLTAEGLVDLNQLIADGKQHLIKGIRWDRAGKMIVEFYDAQSALQLLGRYHALFSDRIKLSRDWRAEMEELGIDPATVFDQLVGQAAAALAEPSNAGGLAGSEAKTQGED